MNPFENASLLTSPCIATDQLQSTKNIKCKKKVRGILVPGKNCCKPHVGCPPGILRYACGRIQWVNKAVDDLHNHSDGNTKYANTENTNTNEKPYWFQAFRNIIPMLCLQQNGWIGSAQSLWKKTQTSGVGIYCWKFGAIHMGVVFIQNVFVTGPFPLVWVSGPCEGWPTQFWYITLHFVNFGKNLLTFALGVSSSSSSGEVGANKYNGRMGSDAHGWREWDGSGMEDFCRAQPDHPPSLPPLLLPPSLLPFLKGKKTSQMHVAPRIVWSTLWNGWRGNGWRGNDKDVF